MFARIALFCVAIAVVSSGCQGSSAVQACGPDEDCSDPACAGAPRCVPRCGDGHVDPGEQCDDGNTVDGDGCSHDCHREICGNGIIDPGEQCDDGNLVDGDGCDHNCTLPACGNGVVDSGEQCDDGNAVDGDGCDRNCTISRCGNGVLDPGEQCDDGNLRDGDGCAHDCTIAICGNGIRETGEQCDDGNTVDGDGCDHNCTVTGCGNGVVTAGEQCDDGNAVDGDGCDHNCTITGCGNGVVDPGEQCDDGNLVDGDGCDHNCTVTGCGNGVIDPGEQCDDGNAVDGDGCDHNCTVTGCGNGIVTAGEKCDDGNLVDGDGCDHNCTVTGCGNGVVTAGEQCDDGNAVDGDGCDHNCTVTACGNGVVTAGEQCDDGNAVDGDGCNSCKLAACPSETPVAPGQGSSIALVGPIARLVADPNRCFLYTVTQHSLSQLVVYSTASKHELLRVNLPRADDIAMSPSGTYLVVAHDAVHTISVIDLTSLQVATTVTTQGDPQIIQVDDSGVAYYVISGQLGEINAIDLHTGIEREIATPFSPDMQLSRDGKFLYTGESGVEPSAFVKYDVSAMAKRADQATTPLLADQRHVFVSPGGQHAYYSDAQFDASMLAFMRGDTGEPVYAEDVRGTFAIGTNHVFDADLVRPIAAMPQTVASAVMTASDQELWYYSAATQRLYYTSTSELVGGAALGVHEIVPDPISSYSFAKLIHDPVRARLYGVDTARSTVVVIDADSLAPLRAILVGTSPTDLAVDAAGTTLFVGHVTVQGFAGIDLASLTFTGFVVAPRITAQIASVVNGGVVTLDEDQLTTPYLLDATTGAVLSQGGQTDDGALSASADGTAVFVGGSGTSGSAATRYSVTSGQLTQTGQSAAFAFPPRSIVALPDGSGAYYAGDLLSGSNLAARYSLGDQVLAVSADGRLALSASNIYDIASGRSLGMLPSKASVLAISPDGSRAFLWTGKAIVAVDLTGF